MRVYVALTLYKMLRLAENEETNQQNFTHVYFYILLIYKAYHSFLFLFTEKQHLTVKA